MTLITSLSLPLYVQCLEPQYRDTLKLEMTNESHLFPGRHHVGHIPNLECFSGLQPQDGGRVNSGVRAGNDHVLQQAQQIQLASTMIREPIPITKKEMNFAAETLSQGAAMQG